MPSVVGFACRGFPSSDLNTSGQRNIFSPTSSLTHGPHERSEMRERHPGGRFATMPCHAGNLMVRRRIFSAVSNLGPRAILRDTAQERGSSG
jgi:hypothetical protein